MHESGQSTKKLLCNQQFENVIGPVAIMDVYTEIFLRAKNYCINNQRQIPQQLHKVFSQISMHGCFILVTMLYKVLNQFQQHLRKLGITLYNYNTSIRAYDGLIDIASPLLYSAKPSTC